MCGVVCGVVWCVVVCGIHYLVLCVCTGQCESRHPVKIRENRESKKRTMISSAHHLVVDEEPQLGLGVAGRGGAVDLQEVTRAEPLPGSRQRRDHRTGAGRLHHGQLPARLRRLEPRGLRADLAHQGPRRLETDALQLDCLVVRPFQLHHHPGHPELLGLRQISRCVPAHCTVDQGYITLKIDEKIPPKYPRQPTTLILPRIEW